MDSRSRQNHRSKKPGVPNVGTNPIASIGQAVALIEHLFRIILTGVVSLVFVYLRLISCRPSPKVLGLNLY